jgi:hypothetical protein
MVLKKLEDEDSGFLGNGGTCSVNYTASYARRPKSTSAVLIIRTLNAKYVSMFSRR